MQRTTHAAYHELMNAALASLWELAESGRSRTFQRLHDALEAAQNESEREYRERIVALYGVEFYEHCRAT